MLKNYVKLIIAILFVSNVMAQNIPSYVPKDGLVGWWPFNGNANDESGNGNHGTVNGATLTSDRFGNANKAYNFDGIDDNIIFNNSPIIKNSKFSISGWIKVNGNPQQSSGALPVINLGYNGYRTTNEIYFGSHQYPPINKLAINTGGARNITSKGELEIGHWKHITLVHQELDYLPSSFTFFIDNKKYEIDNYGSSGTPFPLNNSMAFGVQLSESDIKSFFNGIIDDIAIYNRALSDQEVKQLYEGCTKETATSNSFNSYVFTNNSSINLSANPTGGTFNGEAVTNNVFNPSKAKLGKNQVKYNFKNSTGCADSTNFEMILVDTLGNKCSTYDTLKIKVQLTTGIKAGQIATMNVYPNPTSDVVIIEASDVAALNGYSYKMVDLQGKQVYKELVTKSKTEISLKSIGAKGVYILHVLDAQGVSIENKKIVLE